MRALRRLYPAASYSLRARLLVFLLIPLLALLLGVSAVMDYLGGLRVADDAYDQALCSTTLALSAIFRRETKSASGEMERAADFLLVDTLDQVHYLIADTQGRRLAGDARMLPLIQKTKAAQKSPAYRFDTLEGEKVRVATSWLSPNRFFPKEVVIVVAETVRKREAAASEIMLIALFGDALFVLVAFFVFFAGMRHAYRPLARIVRQIEARQSDDLSLIDERAAPREIYALIRAMNRLLSHLQGAGVAQQNFISSAAHQLRSPLAALQAQIDVAAKSAREEIPRHLRVMRESVIRLSRLIKQMLALARAAPNANRNVEWTPLALEALIENAASDFVDSAASAGVDLGFELAPANVMGVAWALREMLANLTDNAIRYVGAGGIVTARCGTLADGRAWLEVEDNGPGIPEAMRERAFSRFVRFSDKADGSGLGLAIVREVAQSHRARAELLPGARGQGLRARVTFPAVEKRPENL
ncbi:MAG: sensor histidine kinase [Zoogloeaceae bacterium]|jgi:two-component system sensor histidine kinase TctE|nr:sensor histidine kinase [Zoogloeaceae bacterium]